MFAHLQGFRSWLATCPKKAVDTQAFKCLPGLVRSSNQLCPSPGIIFADSGAAGEGLEGDTSLLCLVFMLPPPQPRKRVELGGQPGQPHPWSSSRRPPSPLHCSGLPMQLQTSHWVHVPFNQANPEAGLLCSSARPLSGCLESGIPWLLSCLASNNSNTRVWVELRSVSCTVHCCPHRSSHLQRVIPDVLVQTPSKGKG